MLKTLRDDKEESKRLETLQNNMTETMRLMRDSGFEPSIFSLHYMQDYDNSQDAVKSCVKVNVKPESNKETLTTLRFIPSIVGTLNIMSSKEISQLRSVGSYILDICDFCDKLNTNFPLVGTVQELQETFENSKKILGY